MTKLTVLNSAVSLYRIPVDQEPGGPSMTRQEFAQECDINGIMARYEKSGLVPVNGYSVPQYLDLTMMPGDLMTAMDIMIQAEASFMSLSANVRKEFDNDPMRFVEFASDPANVERMREWGLAAPAPLPDEPIEVRLAKEPEAPPLAPAKP